MRPTMTTTYTTTKPNRSSMSDTATNAVSGLIRFALISAVVVGVGYIAGESLGLWDLKAGETVERINDQRADEAAVMDMLRGGN